jgi:hypothetical protein
VLSKLSWPGVDLGAFASQINGRQDNQLQGLLAVYGVMPRSSIPIRSAAHTQSRRTRTGEDRLKIGSSSSRSEARKPNPRSQMFQHLAEYHELIGRERLSSLVSIFSALFQHRARSPLMDCLTREFITEAGPIPSLDHCRPVASMASSYPFG